MRTFPVCLGLLTFFALNLGPAARADSIALIGRQAQVLFEALYRGGVGGCGNGQCGVAAHDPFCEKFNKERRYECDFIEPLSGAKVFFEDRDAQRLYSAMQNGGLTAGCADVSCQLTAQHIRCARETASTGRPMYYCKIDH